MKFPIKYKLLSVILLIFVPLLVAAVHHYFAMLDHEKADINGDNLAIATHVANNIDDVINASFAALRSLAKHPAVISKNSQACDRLFSELLPSYPVHLNILAAGMDGFNYGSGVPSPDVRTLNYSDRDWFVNARTGMDVVGDLHTSKLFRISSVMIAAPVFDSKKKQVGVIGMPLNLAAIRNLIIKLLPYKEGSSITIVDSKDNILACTGEQQNGGTCKKVPSRIMQLRERNSGSVESRGVDGTDRLYSFASLSRTNWGVIVGVPREVAYIPAYSFGKRYIIVLSIISALALLLSYIISRKMMVNVSALITGMKEIEQGNLTHTLTLSGHDELQNVAESFSLMAAKRKEVEEKLRESEAFRTAVLDGLGEGVVVIGKDYRVLSANQGYCAQVKMSCDDIIGKYCYKLSHHIDQPCFEKEGGCDCTVKKCFETGGRHRSLHTHYDKDGNPRYFETNAYPLKDSSGAIIAAIETLMDVTDLITLQQRLEEARERYRTLYDDAPDMMHSVDRNGDIIICNKTEAATLGYTVEELVGRPQKDIIAPEEREACSVRMTSLIVKGVTEGEVKLLTKDGRRIPAFIRARAIYDKDGNFQMSDAILRDITEKKNLEAQLLHAQKMEAVGLLAGGVAHDFNNVLTVIVGYGNILLRNLEQDSKSHEYIEQILAATDRAAGLTKSLLAFSRKQIINPKPILVSDVVTQLEKILSRVIGEDIELHVSLSPQEAAVLADVGQIDQMLMNLATNARDAMPNGGILSIKSELMEFDADYVRRHAYAKPGRYMIISVTDTGEGFDAKTKEKIFEPFFTTKEVGKGSGLGLSMVYGIIKQHDGYIDVYSEPGKGTTFKIYLPIIEQEAMKIETPILTPVIGGTETILLAEDSGMIRDLAIKVLEEYGYRVLVADNGLEALEKYKSNGDIDLLILDVIMPGKNGKEVYDEIRSQRPDMKTLFMSGYTANVIYKKGMLESGTEFITKPFSPNIFLRKVREVLDKKSAI